MFNDLSSIASYLATRRSAKPALLGAPGPDAATLREICASAIRTPDHGKLTPWRLVIIGVDQRDAFAQMLLAARDPEERDERKDEALIAWAHQAPALVTVLFKPVAGHKIPLFEQEMSAGALCMNLLHAAHARGFVGGWVTTWAADDANVVAAMGGGEGDRIAGFLFIGTPAGELEERPRPEYASVVSRWTPPA